MHFEYSCFFLIIIYLFRCYYFGAVVAAFGAGASASAGVLPRRRVLGIAFAAGGGEGGAAAGGGLGGCARMGLP
jgi:hypothetical protein